MLISFGNFYLLGRYKMFEFEEDNNQRDYKAETSKLNFVLKLSVFVVLQVKLHMDQRSIEVVDVTEVSTNLFL